MVISITNNITDDLTPLHPHQRVKPHEAASTQPTGELTGMRLCSAEGDLYFSVAAHSLSLKLQFPCQPALTDHDVSTEANPGNSSMLLKGASFDHPVCISHALSGSDDELAARLSPSSILSAHNLRQGGELIVLNTAVLYPPFYGICSRDSRPEQFKPSVE